MRLSEAYRRFVESLLQVLTSDEVESLQFDSFMFEFPAS